MRLLIKFCLVATFLLLSSCGDVCPGGKDLVNLPDGFKVPVEGLVSHTKWTFTNDSQSYDTLIAIRPFETVYDRADCSGKQRGIKLFRWLSSTGCDTDTIILELVNSTRLIISFYPKNRNSNCFDLETEYDPGNKKFTKNFSGAIPKFETPFKDYEDVSVFNYLTSYSEGAIFYTPNDGILGYTLETDTFRITAIN